MKDFYTENKRYIKLKEELIKIKSELAFELLEVVDDAIMYGMNRLEENLKAIRGE